MPDDPIAIRCTSAHHFKEASASIKANNKILKGTRGAPRCISNRSLPCRPNILLFKLGMSQVNPIEHVYHTRFPSHYCKTSFQHAQ